MSPNSQTMCHHPLSTLGNMYQPRDQPKAHDWDNGHNNEDKGVRKHRKRRTLDSPFLKLLIIFSSETSPQMPCLRAISPYSAPIGPRGAKSVPNASKAMSRFFCESLGFDIGAWSRKTSGVVVVGVDWKLILAKCDSRWQVRRGQIGNSWVTWNIWTRARIGN